MDPAISPPTSTSTQISTTTLYLLLTTTHHALIALYIYTRTTYTGWSSLYATTFLASTTLSCFGLWVLMFGNEKGRLSKSTGADKRTGNFPFVNAESAREVKKEAREKERGKRRSVARTSSSRG